MAMITSIVASSAGGRATPGSGGLGLRRPSRAIDTYLGIPTVVPQPGYEERTAGAAFSHPELVEKEPEPIEKHGARFSKFEQDVLADYGMNVPEYDTSVQWRVDGQEFFDDPHSSLGANYFSTLVLLCIIVSTITLCIETLPQYQDKTSVDNLFAVEAFCVFIFSVEYGCRVGLAYRRLNFVMGAMNVVDFVAILPFYITLIATVVFGKTADELSSLAVLRLIRLVRVFRILKLARNMPTLKLIVMAVIESASSLTLMLFILLVMLIVFGAFEYFFEQGTAGFCQGSLDDYGLSEGACTGMFGAENKTRIWVEDAYNRMRCGTGYNGLEIDRYKYDCSLSPFTSIPEAMWWCLVTLLTVGYGDIYPVTIGGKIVACASMVISVVILALPISIIGTNFVDFWAIEEAHQIRKQDPGQLAISAKTTQQSLRLFIQIIKYNIEKSEELKRRILAQISEMGPSTREERKGSPTPARQAQVYKLKALEQQLYLLRTKNLRLLPLEDADDMIAEARSILPSNITTGGDATDELTTESERLRNTWKNDRLEASLSKVLRRSRENARWFQLMQDEHIELLKDLNAMRQILDVIPGQFGGDTETE